MISKALSVRRAKAGSLLKTIREINAMKLGENDILVGHRYHTAGSESYFLNTSYTYTKRLGAIQVDLNGRCVVSEEIGTEIRLPCTTNRILAQLTHIHPFPPCH